MIFHIADSKFIHYNVGIQLIFFFKETNILLMLIKVQKDSEQGVHQPLLIVIVLLFLFSPI